MPTVYTPVTVQKWIYELQVYSAISPSMVSRTLNRFDLLLLLVLSHGESPTFYSFTAVIHAPWITFRRLQVY